MELQTFDFTDAPVRVALQDGEPWFVAADVCRVLDVTNPRDAVAGLDDDERMTVANTDGHSGQRGGAQSFNIISEAGLYSLIFRSRKPQAKAFKRWVTHEVLPTIRKTGSYQRNQVALEQQRRAETEREMIEATVHLLRLQHDLTWRYATGGASGNKLAIVTRSSRSFTGLLLAWQGMTGNGRERALEKAWGIVQQAEEVAK